MRELQFISSGQLEWREKEAPSLQGPRDAIVRPFVASRCDGDVLPIHRPVSRAMQVGLRTGLIDPVVGSILGTVPFQGPFGIGHECIAQVVTLGDEVTNLSVGQVVVVPWAISCGSCPECLRGVTAKCSTAGRQHLVRLRVRAGQRTVGRHGRRRDPGAVRRPHARAGPRRRGPVEGRRCQRQPVRRLAHRGATA